MDAGKNTGGSFTSDVDFTCFIPVYEQERTCSRHPIQRLLLPQQQKDFWQKSSAEKETLSLLLICSSAISCFSCGLFLTSNFGGSFPQIAARFNYKSEEKK